jgi:anti-anti-sigma factor
MEISKQQSGKFTELVVKGRLDGYWADHLTASVEEVIRGGADHVRLNMAGVGYISSMGVRVLVHFYKQLSGINGVFALSNPSEPVKRVLDMMRLGDLLIAREAEQPAPATAPETGRRIDTAAAAFEVFDYAPGAALKCSAVGDPALLASGGYTKDHARTLTFPESSMAIGLGAFGDHYDDCRTRFGEFLSVAGAAAYQPTDGSNVADYLVSEGSFVPELQVLYSLVCEGKFASLARFEATETAPLSALLESCLDISGAPSAGIVMIAESAGLVGAALRRSPAECDRGAPTFEHPGIRQWLSYSAERTHTRSLAVVAGVAARSANGKLGPMLRPIGAGSALAGHFHAAAFSYRPLQKGRIELPSTVKSVFEAETLQGVLHLLADDRESAAAPQSEFVRGACWIGPIGEVA